MRLSRIREKDRWTRREAVIILRAGIELGPTPLKSRIEQLQPAAADMRAMKHARVGRIVGRSSNAPACGGGGRVRADGDDLLKLR